MKFINQSINQSIEFIESASIVMCHKLFVCPHQWSREPLACVPYSIPVCITVIYRQLFFFCIYSFIFDFVFRLSTDAAEWSLIFSSVNFGVTRVVLHMLVAVNWTIGHNIHQWTVIQMTRCLENLHLYLDLTKLKICRPLSSTRSSFWICCEYA